MSQAPMVIPYIAAGYLFILLLSENGWLSAVLFQSGLLESQGNFYQFLYTRNGSGIIAAYLWKTTPFVIMIAYPVILRIDEGWISMGRILGASRTRLFFEIVFPLLIPSLIISSLLVFAYIFGAFEIPFLLGATYPRMISVEAYELFTRGTLLQKKEAYALGTIIFLITSLAGLLLLKAVSFFQKRTGGGW